MVKAYSTKKEGNVKLEDNFKVSEFACKDGTDGVLIDTTLTSILQIVRNYFSVPVTITSAYRTKAHNAAVGGASNSQHLQGKAADIVVKNVRAATVYNYLNSILGNWGGLICYNKEQFVHVDTRANKYREVK